VPLAQWIEHLATNQEVGGSNPSGHGFGLIFLCSRSRNFRKKNNNIIEGAQRILQCKPKEDYAGKLSLKKP
jgi:hypothetical protein